MIVIFKYTEMQRVAYLRDSVEREPKGIDILYCQTDPTARYCREGNTLFLREVAR